VTRRVCEKVAQNVGQPIFFVEINKVAKKMDPIKIIFKELPKVNNRPIHRRKLAQSGHPVRPSNGPS
jgi:hypothetical protein